MLRYVPALLSLALTVYCVIDAFQTYLREMRPNDLEGSAGLYRLRDELTRRVNLAVAPSKINAVLFKEIVVQ